MPDKKHLQLEIQNLLAKAEWWLSANPDEFTILPFASSDSSLKQVKGEDEYFSIAFLEDGSILLSLGEFDSISATGDWIWEPWRYLQAIACYKKVLEIDPECVFALIRMGLLHLEIAGHLLIDDNAISNAVEFLERATEVAPFDPVACFILAYALDKLEGAEEEANELYQIVWEEEPSLFIAPPDQCQRGAIGCYTFGDACYSAFISRDQLLKIYEGAEFRFPDVGLIKLNMIELKTTDPLVEGELLKSTLGWMEKWVESMKPFESQLQGHFFGQQKEMMGYQMLQLFYASWLDAQGNRDGARIWYDDFFNRQHYEWVERVNGYWQEQLWPKLFEPMTNFYLKEGSRERAERVCAEFCAKRQTEIEAWVEYVEIVSEQDVERAVKICRDTINRKPSPELYKKLAQIYHLKLNDISGALQALEEGKVVFSRNPEFMVVLYEYEVYLSRNGQAALKVKRQELQNLFGPSIWQFLGAETRKDLATAEYLKERYESVDEFSLAAVANVYCRAWEREVKARINEKIISYARLNKVDPKIEIGTHSGSYVWLNKATPVQIGIALENTQTPTGSSSDVVRRYVKTLDAKQEKLLTKKFPQRAKEINKIRRGASHTEPISKVDLLKLREQIMPDQGKSKGAIALLIEWTS